MKVILRVEPEDRHQLVATPTRSQADYPSTKQVVASTATLLAGPSSTPAALVAELSADGARSTPSTSDGLALDTRASLLSASFITGSVPEKTANNSSSVTVSSTPARHEASEFGCPLNSPTFRVQTPADSTSLSPRRLPNGQLVHRNEYERVL